jgi:hypothetical protein
LSNTHDLVEQLAAAAADAVRKRRAAIEDGAANLAGVVVEPKLARVHPEPALRPRYDRGRRN